MQRRSLSCWRRNILSRIYLIRESLSCIWRYFLFRQERVESFLSNSLQCCHCATEKSSAAYWHFGRACRDFRSKRQERFTFLSLPALVNVRRERFGGVDNFEYSVLKSYLKYFRGLLQNSAWGRCSFSLRGVEPWYNLGSCRSEAS